MLVDRVIKYYDAEYDLNCAECIMVAANEEYDMDMSKDAIKASAVLGGGMGIGSICGAATGALSVIGIMFTRERGHESPHVKQLTIQFLGEFQERMKSLNCSNLIPMYKTSEERCLYIVKTAAEILDEIVINNKDRYCNK